MGTLKAYMNGTISDGLEYRTVKSLEAGGVSGKMLEKWDLDENTPFDLPLYANTSQLYFRANRGDATEVIQMRVYGKDRRAAIDYDWGHPHKEFPMGVVHVHEWRFNKNGKWVKSDKVRLMTMAEITKYGPILRQANPSVRFR